MAFAALVSSFGRSIRRHSGRKRGVGSLGIILESIGALQAGGSRLSFQRRVDHAQNRKDPADHAALAPKKIDRVLRPRVIFRFAPVLSDARRMARRQWFRKRVKHRWREILAPHPLFRRGIGNRGQVTQHHKSDEVAHNCSIFYQ